jgi:aspartate carbamoyltransferase catalytic subunit
MPLGEWPKNLFRHPFIGVRVLTQREQPILASLTISAGDGERHHHPVAYLQVFHIAAHFHHFAHKLMAENIPRLTVGIKPL